MNIFVETATFNKLLSGLLEYISKKFPEDRNIACTRLDIDNAAKLTPKLPALYFMNNCEPYLDEIKNRNTDFFLHLASTEYNSMFGHFDLHEKFSVMTEADRQYLWKTIDSLLKVGSKVILMSGYTTSYVAEK